MKPGKGGVKVWKQIHVKVIVGEKTFTFNFRAEARHGYSTKDIEEQLERVIEHIDRSFPKLDFKQVELGPNRFNFIAQGWRNIHGNTSTEHPTVDNSGDARELVHVPQPDSGAVAEVSSNPGRREEFRASDSGEHAAIGGSDRSDPQNK